MNQPRNNAKTINIGTMKKRPIKFNSVIDIYFYKKIKNILIILNKMNNLANNYVDILMELTKRISLNDFQETDQEAIKTRLIKFKSTFDLDQERESFLNGLILKKSE